MESVTAERILEEMREGGSVRRMRELGSLADLDILALGSLRERTRRVGAEVICRANEVGLLIRIVGV